MKIKPTFFRRLLAACQLSLVLPALLGAAYQPGSTTAEATLPEQLIGSGQQFLEQAVSDYLQRSEIQARHEIEIHQLDPRLRLPVCDKALSTALESPAQPVGRVTIKVRCEGTNPWTIFVPGQVHIYRSVLIASRPLKRATVLSETDLKLVERDVGLLNQGYLTSIEQAVDKKLTRQLLTDQVLAPAHLQQAEVIRKGDHVVITARSAGISVRMTGEALTDGALGEQIRVRNQGSGRSIRVRVTGPGQVEAPM
ncbi:MAG: flagellar basal body P-ring formation chaperone FlgA [Pseudomonas sp.]|uniref:flagellar basal body P-ring formation chaperone FlgA n=1 Tax=Pseudomonas sp. TaxID=306 RepID=UPI0027375FF2|nr:flagellar basal body P-ring formation chaperone FlgA [Pseudomonas sp.]MDP3846039.1 flagellar basal body P-ring formation chaperone FlgA [Pseudomonas sp.]